MQQKIYLLLLWGVLTNPVKAQIDYQLLSELIREDTTLGRQNNLYYGKDLYLMKLQDTNTEFDDKFYSYLYGKSLICLESKNEIVKQYGYSILFEVIENSNDENLINSSLKNYVTKFKYDYTSSLLEQPGYGYNAYISTLPLKYYREEIKDSLRAYFKLPDSLFAKREIFYGKIGLAYLMADLGMTDQIPEVRAFVQRNDSLFQAKKRKTRNYLDTDIDEDFYLHLTLAKFLVPEEIDYCITAVSNFIQAGNILPYDYNYLFEWLAQVKHKKVIDYFEEELKNKAQDINVSTGFVWPFAYTITSEYLPKIIKDFPKPDKKQINFYKSEKNTLGYMKKFIKECQEWLKANKDTLEILR